MNNFLDFMDVELPNKLKPNHLKEHSEKYHNIIEYYSRVEELRNCKNVSDKEITLLFNSILKHHPGEWLLLFDLLEMNSENVEKKMSDLNKYGKFKLSVSEAESFKNVFDAGSLKEDETINIIKDVYEYTNNIIDPHTAIGVGVHNKNSYENSIVLSTAHAAKFPKTVEKAIGVYPELPIKTDDIYQMQEKIVNLKSDIDEISSYITKNFSE